METKKVKSTKNPKNTKGAGGRPTALTPEVLDKLKYAYNLGCTDREACLFADISEATLYNHKLKNPKFLEEITVWKEKPILLARQAVLLQIQGGDGELALKYLERKKKDEFAPKSSLDIGVSQELSEVMEKIKERLTPKPLPTKI